MSNKEKLQARLLKRPKDFTYQELESLLKSLGYIEVKKGKTSGSRRAFINETSKHIIRLHKPHPGNEIKLYLVDYLIEELKKEGSL